MWRRAYGYSTVRTHLEHIYAKLDVRDRGRRGRQGDAPPA
jgi:DNA-binding CsgD family transcriptional regulator